MKRYGKQIKRILVVKNNNENYLENGLFCLASTIEGEKVSMNNEEKQSNIGSST